MVQRHWRWTCFVPSDPEKPLAPNQAYKALRVVKKMLWAIDRGTQVVIPPEIEEYQARKHGKRAINVYDREDSDLFILVPDGEDLALVTVARIWGERTMKMDFDHRVSPRASKSEAVVMPYVLAPGPIDPRLSVVEKKSKLKIPVEYKKEWLPASTDVPTAGLKGE